MDMPPAGWYPDPYGVPDLLRWWDGSTWTQHTHQGSGDDPADDSGPATTIDATGVSAPSATAVQAAVQLPSAEQTALDMLPLDDGGPGTRGADVTVADPPGVSPLALTAGPGRAGSSWPGAGLAGPASPALVDPDADTNLPGAIPPVRAEHGTRVLDVPRDGWGDPGAPGHGPALLPGYGGYGPGRDQRRRHLLMGGALAAGTAVALALIALVVTNLNRAHPAAPSVAQSTAAPAVTSASPTQSPQASATTATPTATPTPTVGVAGQVTDSASGLSYSLLSAPWANGCPPKLSSQQTLTWTQGEAVPDGQVTSNGTPVNWFGEACSAPLPPSDGYTGVADLEPVATNLVNQFDGTYYGPLNHQRTQLESTPVSVSQHPGWEVKYLMTYPDAASMGLAFNSEEGAVVVIDQGTGLPPAVFFVSVPYNENFAEVDALVSSLTLTTPQSATPSAAATPPVSATASPTSTINP